MIKMGDYEETDTQISPIYSERYKDKMNKFNMKKFTVQVKIQMKNRRKKYSIVKLTLLCISRLLNMYIDASFIFKILLKSISRLYKSVFHGTT